MPETKPKADGDTQPIQQTPTLPPDSEPVSGQTVPVSGTGDVKADAAPSNPSQNAPAAHTSYFNLIEKMYDKGEISADIMASAIEHNWTPSQTIAAERKRTAATGGQSNVAGYPAGQTENRSNEPNGDFIMASAYLQTHCDFSPDEVRRHLHIDDRSLDASTSSHYRGVRFSDICAHAVNAYSEKGNNRGRVNVARWKPLDLYNEALRIQDRIDEQYAPDPDDIKADADTGISTIGLKNIWSLINTATIGKGYQSVETNWRKICSKASVPNFLKRTVHHVNMLGDFQRLNPIGQEPPHATYSESQFDSQIDTWGLMLAFSRQDIINDEVGVFTNAAADLGRKSAKILEKECWAALLSLGNQIFTSTHHNLLSGAGSAFSFDALDKAYTLFRKQKDPDGQPIDVRPAFLVLPSALFISATDLLSMGTKDGTDKGVQNRYKALRDGIVDSPYLDADNGLFTYYGSNKTNIPGSDTAWYLFSSPSELPVLTATFLNGKETATVERANMRFTLDGVQFKAIIDFEFNGNEFRGAVKATGV